MLRGKASINASAVRAKERARLRVGSMQSPETPQRRGALIPLGGVDFKRRENEVAAHGIWRILIPSSPGETMKKPSGDRFEYFKRGALWYWHLEGAYHPVGPIAKSRQGYRSKLAVLHAIKSARLAANGAAAEPIEREAPPV